MLKKLQLALTTFVVMADVRSYQWFLLHNLRKHPSTERIDDAILYRHRLRQFIEEFLDSGDPHLWNLTANGRILVMRSLKSNQPTTQLLRHARFQVIRQFIDHGNYSSGLPNFHALL
jgi:hypothetical protein